MKLDKLKPTLISRIEADRVEGKQNPYAFCDTDCIRRNPDRDKANLWRPAFVRDCEKILHSSYFDRYADKTQVFSFSKNDDITRRAQHVQLVSRIARNIGRVLNLNLDLIEAIALGHDIGHTPFGHAGERILNELSLEYLGRYFKHNVHSVRVLEKIIPYNLTLQTLNGIICHNGEMELSEYKPLPMHSFEQFDDAVERCYTEKGYDLSLVPATLEGCVVRISDIISYLGKDRQDAEILGKLPHTTPFADSVIGTTNAEIINNLTVNIIQNSYGKPFIAMDTDYFDALSVAKRANYELIYQKDTEIYDDVVAPMMREIFEKLLRDLEEGKMYSPIFRHHMDFVNASYYRRIEAYERQPKAQIVVDYIASMTDDYFLELYSYLFPKSDKKIEIKGYF